MFLLFVNQIKRHAKTHNLLHRVINPKNLKSIERNSSFKVSDNSHSESLTCQTQTQFLCHIQTRLAAFFPWALLAGWSLMALYQDLQRLNFNLFGKVAATCKLRTLC